MTEPVRVAEYSAKSLVRVEFYTRSYHVSGDVEVNRWRLADVLNDRSQPFVLIGNVVREPLPAFAHAAGAEFARAAQYIQVGRESILFAIPHDAPELEGARKQYLLALYAERTMVSATAVSPPFEIRGTVHLRGPFRIRQALEGLPAEFMPMTYMEAVYLLDPRLRVTADFAVINRGLAELFTLSGEGVLPGSRALRRR